MAYGTHSHLNSIYFPVIPLLAKASDNVLYIHQFLSHCPSALLAHWGIIITSYLLNTLPPSFTSLIPDIMHQFLLLLVDEFFCPTQDLLSDWFIFRDSTRACSRVAHPPG